MPVGIGVKRVKPTFQQVLLQLNPFFWQGDASWKWNSKVELWTGAAPDFVSPCPATARAALARLCAMARPSPSRARASLGI